MSGACAGHSDSGPPQPAAPLWNRIAVRSAPGYSPRVGRLLHMSAPEFRLGPRRGRLQTGAGSRTSVGAEVVTSELRTRNSSVVYDLARQYRQGLLVHLETIRPNKAGSTTFPAARNFEIPKTWKVCHAPKDDASVIFRISFIFCTDSVPPLARNRDAKSR